jgi:hypothetical protein
VQGGVKKTLAGMNFKANDGKVTPMDHVIELDESKVEVQYGGAGAYGNAAEVSQILHFHRTKERGKRKKGLQLTKGLTTFAPSH